jgi:CRP/FNR family transcriptional regulator
MTASIEQTKLEEFLADIWAFQFLDEEHLRSLAGLTNARDLKEGQVLWLQGQRVTFFTMVFDGELQALRRSSRGSEKLVSDLKRGRHFGLAETITGATSAVTVIAREPTKILTLEARALKRLLLQNSELCYRLMQTMARAIFSLTQELERASFETIHTRLARLLLRRCEPANLSYGRSHQTTHAEIARRLGVSRETISRVLNDFRAQGLIDTAYRAITVRDRDGLMQYVEDYDQW